MGANLKGNQAATYDFTLPATSAREIVTVSAAAATPEMSTSKLGTAIQTRAVNNLPLNGRNFKELLTLTPGV